MVNLFLPLGLLLLVSVANAHDEISKKYVRFIILGDFHLGNLTSPDNEALLLFKEIPKEIQPPIALHYSADVAVKPLPLPLLQFSPYATLRGDDESLILKNTATKGGGEFLKSPAPVGEVNLGVLFPNLETMHWIDPQILMLKDDAKSFPVGQIRFVNTSDRTVLVKLEGHSPFGVKAGATSLKILKDIGSFKGEKFVQPLDERAYMEVGFRNSNNQARNLFSNNLNFREGERIQCFFYKSKGDGSSKELRYTLIPERVPTLPEPLRR